MKIKFYLLFLILLFNAEIFKAQIPRAPLSVKSPNVASLDLIDQIPLTKFTGLPQIEIPIYELQQGDVSIPLSMSYHASGFRPDMHPGWVGLGWNLNVGGVITRIKKDNVDEYSLSRGGGTAGINDGFFFNFNILNDDNWNTKEFILEKKDKAVAKDMEPDEFSFTVNNISGKFYLDHLGRWKIKCNRPVKVAVRGEFLEVPFKAAGGSNIDLNGNSKTFSGFSITDEFGNEYIFGGSSAIEYSIGFFDQGASEWIADSWYLTKIINAKGVTDFTYERDHPINQMYLSTYSLWKSTLTGGSNLDPNCSTGAPQGLQNSYTGKLISPVYLKSISGLNGRITFSRSTTTELRYDEEAYRSAYSRWYTGGSSAEFIPYLTILSPEDKYKYYPNTLDALRWKQLDTIKIFDREKKLLKTVKLTYSSDISKRLTLLTLQEKGQFDVNKEPYKFYYDTSKVLPGYLANMMDHWGFYNGNFAPFENLNEVRVYSTHREPNESFLYAGTLNKIKYPIGGYNEFIYEPHRYQKRLKENRSEGIDPNYNLNTLAGGLRIKKILQYDKDNIQNPIIKEYFYVSGYSNNVNISNLPSSGILGGQMKYYFEDFKVPTFGSSGGSIYTSTVFSSQSVLPATSNALGSHVGYTEVVEKNSDGGYVKSIFTNFDSGHLDEPGVTVHPDRTGYEPYSNLEEERGKLKMEEIRRADNALLKREQWQYEAIDKENQYVRSITTRAFSACKDFATMVYDGTAYRLYTYSYLPVRHTETIIDNVTNTSVVKTVDTKYDQTTKLKKKETFLNSKKDSIVINYSYILDHQYINTTGPYKDMKGKNMIGFLIQTETLKNGNPIKKITYDYTSNWPQNRELILPYSIVTKDGNGEEQDNLRFLAYDRNGNVTETITNGKQKMAYIWGTNGESPIATVKNASANDVAFSSFEEPGGGNWLIPPSRDNLQSVSGNYCVRLIYPDMIIAKPGLDATKTYYLSFWFKANQSGDPGEGYLKTIGPNKDGWSKYEKYFTGQTNVVISHQNAMIDDLTLYPADAEMTSHVFLPLIGLVSQIDGKGQTTYYQYDEFQRLKNIKDQNGNIINSYDYHYKP